MKFITTSPFFLLALLTDIKYKFITTSRSFLLALLSHVALKEQNFDE